jgi:hypothetical protein
MIGVNGVGVLKKEEYLASPSRFQNFDDALNELTRKLYEGEYYNTPNSSIFILYNLKLHRFQTLACSSSSIQYGNRIMNNDHYNKMTIDYNPYQENKHQQKKDNKQQRFSYSYEKTES